MTVFWLLTMLVVLFACLVLAIPLFSQVRSDAQAERDQLNKAFYRDRLSELNAEIDCGVASDQDGLLSDLKQSLLEDIPENEQHRGQGDIKLTSPVRLFFPSVLVIMAISYGIYASVGALPEVERWQQARNTLNPLLEKLMSGQGEELSEAQMQDVVLGLRTRLQDTPDDAQGWLLLGRVALSGQDLQTGGDAMKKAYQLQSDDPDIRLGFAQTLMMSSNDVDQAKGRTILQGLVQENYADLRVYSMLAFDAYRRQEFQTAVQYWHIMQQVIGPQDKRYTMLERSIASARNKIKAVGSSGVSIPVTISLADNVRYPAEAALIVSVTDGEGSPVPVAAARFAVGHFPRTVVLDESSVMMQGQKLSELEKVQVKARIDIDGNVATREGDWFGVSSVMKLGEPVAITIKNKY